MSATILTALDLYDQVISAKQGGGRIFLIKETEKGVTEKEVLFF